MPSTVSNTTSTSNSNGNSLNESGKSGNKVNYAFVMAAVDQRGCVFVFDLVGNR